ncbi:hypothetical protein [Paenibacillus sp. 1001270B_150601_E10]|uniref:hypothetical protein n=1 Tax=Paenibacillus sp. 1001270B_150601_E10 TaxID=2787079 RepID=UPI00189F7B61|nr:hypothetical protein [Paenibacillus sp. 1001270B_150601_E10]
MQQFSNVLREYRKWILAIPFVNVIIPFALYILFGSIAVDFLCKLILTIFPRIYGYGIYSMISILDSLAYFGFWIGFWLVLATKEMKLAPYALFATVFVTIFPFTSFSLFTVLKAVIFIWLGYQLLKFTASSSYSEGNESGMSI